MSASRWCAFGCFVAAAFVYVATAAHGYISLDVVASDFGSWHLAQAGNPWLDHARIPVSIADNPLRSAWIADVHGRPVIARSPGTIAMSWPAYWLFGGSAFSMTPAAVTAALVTAGAVALVFLTVRTRLSSRQALVATLAFGFATPVWSVAADGAYPHTLTVLGICGMAWAAASDRWWLAGLFGGITLWGRLHAAVIVAVLGLLVAWHRRDPRIALKTGVVSTCFLGLMSVWTHWMYGSWDPTASYDAASFADYSRTHALDLVNQLGFWVSPGRGILVWTPLVLVMLPALFRSWRALPDWSRSLLYGGLVYCVLQGLLNRYSGGSGFYGYRLGLEVLASMAPALAFSIPRLGTVGRYVGGAVLGVQLYAISLGAITGRNGGMTMDPWHTNFFVVRLDDLGSPGLVLLAVFAVLGVAAAYAARRFSVAPRPDAGRRDEHDEPAIGERTVVVSDAG